MACKEDTDASAQEFLTTEICKSELESRRLQVDSLEAELLDVKAYLEFGSSEEDARKELGVLSGRVRTTATMLRYLRSKARILVIPDLAHHHLSCGVEQMELKEGGGSSSGVEDRAYTNEMLESIEMVTRVLESLVRRVAEAESETAVHKEMVLLGEEEICRKTVQIEHLSVRLEEMEKFARGTYGVMEELRERIEELVEETARQKARAEENDEELCRVKREFESLKAYVSNFTSVRETLLSSERQFKTIEGLFERSVT